MLLLSRHFKTDFQNEFEKTACLQIGCFCLEKMSPFHTKNDSELVSKMAFRILLHIRNNFGYTPLIFYQSKSAPFGRT